jgi:methionyl-tRNA synthetase
VLSLALDNMICRVITFLRFYNKWTKEVHQYRQDNHPWVLKMQKSRLFSILVNISRGSNLLLHQTIPAIMKKK